MFRIFVYNPESQTEFFNMESACHLWLSFWLVTTTLHRPWMKILNIQHTDRFMTIMISGLHRRVNLRLQQLNVDMKNKYVMGRHTKHGIFAKKIHRWIKKNKTLTLASAFFPNNAEAASSAVASYKSHSSLSSWSFSCTRNPRKPSSSRLKRKGHTTFLLYTFLVCVCRCQCHFCFEASLPIRLSCTPLCMWLVLITNFLIQGCFILNLSTLGAPTRGHTLKQFKHELLISLWHRLH